MVDLPPKTAREELGDALRDLAKTWRASVREDWETILRWIRRLRK